MGTPTRPLAESCSNPDLSTNTANIMESNNTALFRKRKHSDDNLSSQMASLMAMFKDFKTEQAANFNKMDENIVSLKQQSNKIETMLTNVTEKYTQLETRVEALEVNEAAASSSISNLSGQVENLQRKLLETTVEIRNIPTDSNEQAADHLKKIHQALSLDFESHFVRSIYRARGKPNTPRPIVVEFSSVSQKIALLRALRSYNKENITDSFNTSLIGLPTKSTIYIGERLTPNCKKLHYLARMAVKKRPI